MDRRNAMVRLGIAWMLPGALLGAGIGALVKFGLGRTGSWEQIFIPATAFGAVLGAVVGMLIADHRYPP